MTGTSNRYVPLVLLARGSDAEVWLGVLEGAAGYKRPVVIKRPSEPTAAARDALVREAHLASALNHPNVVHVYELVETPDGLALVMEYLLGLPLDALARHAEGRMPWAAAARIIADAARGLDHAHRARDTRGRPLGIVHRDVSPKNLLVTDEGMTKVVDFGIARAADRNTAVGRVVRGTLGYLSPEQARGLKVDWRSDLFSLGVVAWELLAGRPLFVREGAQATLEAVMRAEVPPLADPVPPVVQDVVRRMLVRDPRARSLGLADAANLLEDAAADAYGTHQHVATFLRAECGSHLEARRAQLRNLLSGTSPLPEPVTGDVGDTGTLAMLEEAFERTDVDVGVRVLADDDFLALDEDDATHVEVSHGDFHAERTLPFDGVDLTEPDPDPE